MTQGVPSAEGNPAREPARGFAGGFLGAVQNRLLASPRGREPDVANPSWQANNAEVVSLNTKIMAASMENLELMSREKNVKMRSLSGEAYLQLHEGWEQALVDFKTMQKSMAHDQVNVDVKSGAHTDADVEARREQLGQLHEANDQLRETLQQHGDLGIPPRRAAAGAVKSAAKSAAPAVVMNRAHVAGLQSLDEGHEDSLEKSGSDFGR
ncbi:hypothetical protein [Arthrobacter sp. ES1]|uniref:hypothetical protein n=1 Tax=Arthrobacter sp. ES1 TaxID=1897056 RepID=UPI001CFFA3B7|nr:hypothetical protein [Arthrobacter sp. ES1]